MSYAFSLADMRTYLSYLQTKKQDIYFNLAADGADTEEDDMNMDPNKKNKDGETGDMEKDADENSDTM
jgi:hypothetical protein